MNTNNPFEDIYSKMYTEEQVIEILTKYELKSWDDIKDISSFPKQYDLARKNVKIWFEQNYIK